MFPDFTKFAADAEAMKAQVTRIENMLVQMTQDRANAFAAIDHIISALDSDAEPRAAISRALSIAKGEKS